MARFDRRSIVLVLAAVGLLGFELLPRDERRVTGLLNDLCAQLNQTRDAATLAALHSALRAALLPEVQVEASELGDDLAGPDAVVRRSSDLLTGPPLSFVLNDVSAHVSGALARVDADLIVTLRGSGEQHRDLRRTQVRLRKLATGWRIEAVRVEPVRPAQPEARP